MDVDQIRINLDQSTLSLLNFCLAFLTFGVALDIRLRDFAQIAEQPRKVLIGLAAQWILLPLWTLFLIFIFQPPASIALGLVLVAACPGGNISNYATHLSKANAALSVTLTSLVTLLAIFSTPLLFRICAKLTPGAAQLLTEISIEPAAVIYAIVFLILSPLLLGLLLANRFPRLAQKIRKPVRFVSLLIFAGMIAGALYANFDNIVQYLKLVFGIVLVHNAVAFVIGFYFSKMNGLPNYDARAVAMETGVQNAGLGLILVFNFFEGLGGMALVTAWWGVWNLVAAFGLASWWARRPV